MSDPYIWLENIDDPKVKEWVLERDKKTREELSSLSSKLLERILEYYRIPYVVSVRLSRRGYYLLVRRYDSYVIERIGSSGSRSILVDSRDLGRNIVIKWMDVSDDGDRLVYSFSSGSDEGIVRIIDTDSLDVVDELYGVVGDIVWIGRDRYYYVRFYRREETPDGVKPPAERVFLRENGREEMVFGKGIPSLYMIGLDKSSDGSKALVTVSYGWRRSSVYAGDLFDPGNWSMIYRGGDYVSVPVDYVNGKYYILCFDRDGMGRLLSLSSSGDIEEVIGEKDYPLRTVEVVDDKFLLYYLVNASSKLVIASFNGEFLDEISFDPPGTVSSLDCLDDKCVFKYESFYIPYRVYLYNNNGLKVLDEQLIEAGDLGVEEFWVRSYDGTPIHVFKVYNKKRDLKKALLYGYGGFSISVTPRFYHMVIPFIEDGGSFFVANIRGGGEYGEKWHRAGMGRFKENVFQDFIAVAQYLKNNGYEVVVWGSSNGGLLTAVTLTRIPDVISGAVIGYPVLDMLRFHKLFIGKLWITEYGNPDDPSDREYLIKYSPYHNLKPNKKYPPAMIYTGLYDDRVHPGHAFKFAAKLEEIGVKYYLRVETVSGHSGADPMVKAREYADILAFIYKTLGMS
ncbi:MAG: peptidase S9 [Desulfurococcales archaeon ex4484_58]|nr:MAG: peptidase S9 [Desulfurococcales archaeon ex4484_58]